MKITYTSNRVWKLSATMGLSMAAFMAQAKPCYDRSETGVALFEHNLVGFYYCPKDKTKVSIGYGVIDKSGSKWSPEHGVAISGGYYFTPEDNDFWKMGGDLTINWAPKVFSVGLTYVNMVRILKRVNIGFNLGGTYTFKGAGISSFSKIKDRISLAYGLQLEFPILRPDLVKKA